MRETTELLVDVQARYGARSAIRFRYVHDFIYGYDWARWVAREPETRTAIGPYDPVFLQRMRHRADELLELIQTNDKNYPQLEQNISRNPFGFSREPGAPKARFCWSSPGPSSFPWKPGEPIPFRTGIVPTRSYAKSGRASWV